MKWSVAKTKIKQTIFKGGHSSSVRNIKVKNIKNWKISLAVFSDPWDLRVFLFFNAQKVFSLNYFYGRTKWEHLNLENFQTFDSNICIYLFGTNWVKVGEQTVNSISLIWFYYSLNHKPLTIIIVW